MPHAQALKQKGFTIVELIVVIAVIAALASITLISYGVIKAKARDGIRRNDLATIKKALVLYNLEKGDWIEDGSGCGYGGNGTGWYDYTNAGASYTASISSCLTGAGYTKSDIIDPTGGTTSTPTSGFAYMKYHCGDADNEQVYLYAKLETVPQSSTATDGTCDSTLDTTYGMNYYLRVK